MRYLVDVNVWVALSLPGHVHHAEARDWFGDPDMHSRLFFCRVTQHGFLRLLTNSKVMGSNVLSAAGAWRYYDLLMYDDRVGFASEPPELERMWRGITRQPHSRPNLWTDAYLLGFARAAGLGIVTFDRWFRQHKDMNVLSPAD
jgi:hypothetical protein